jgi:hypothetical protein
MKIFLAMIIFIFLGGNDTWAAAPAKDDKKIEISEDKAFMKELDSIRDPFVSPFAKKEKKPEVKIVQPVVPVEPVIPPPPPKPVAQRVEPVRPVQLPSPVRNVLQDTSANLFSMTGIKINGVIWNTNMPQAIINDHIFRVGDDLHGGKIVAIKKEGIEVSYLGVKYMMSIADQKDDTASTTNRNPALDMMRGR